MTKLFIDLETYSSVDIASAGSYKYIESDDFEILLVAYAFEDELVEVVEWKDAPERVLDALTDGSVVKIAHNAHGFERQALGKVLGAYMRPAEWEDTMILSARNGLPMSLDAVGDALHLTQQKLKEGTALINYFCKPCRPTASNGQRTRNLPEHAPDKWSRFKAYCKRDVDAMRELYWRLHAKNSIPMWESQVERLDCTINERGVQIDADFVRAAVDVDAEERAQNLAELKRLTGLQNPNSAPQLRAWLSSIGVDLPEINKAVVSEVLATAELPASARRALELRQLLGKTSTKKYDTMLTASCKDDRVRGTMQFYGAGRTGRWAGRLIQVQNLPQNHLEDIGLVRDVVKARDLDTLRLCFDSVPDTLSQLIRTGLVAKEGHTFLVADYSAIEARVIAYLAGERWRLETFANGGDIYCSSASQMFKVPVEKHGQNAHLRQKGKIAELACGYGGGVNALKAFGADKMGLTDAEMQEIVTNWRKASPTIPRFWREAEDAAKTALNCKYRRVKTDCGCEFYRDADALRLQLPSGRVLSYWGAALDEDGSICFMAQNQTTRKWTKTQTWGGKLVENIVQAFARDCLAWAMLRLDAARYKICFSVHDELICEEPKNGRSWQEMAEIMGQPLPWAEGLKLRAEGYSTEFYRKD